MQTILPSEFCWHLRTVWDYTTRMDERDFYTEKPENEGGDLQLPEVPPVI